MTCGFTNGALRVTSAVTVANGGTGAATLTGVLTGNGTSAITANAVTQHGVLIGGASNAVSSLGVATTGQILAGNTGADPSFQSASSLGSSWVHISTVNASNQASVTFADTNYNTYVLVVDGAVPVSNAQPLQLQYTTNSGSTYINSGYVSGMNIITYNATTWSNSNASAVVFLGPSMDNTANGGCSGVFYLYNFNLSKYFFCTGQSTVLTSAVLQNALIGSLNSTTGANGISITFGTGNISTGKFSFYGIRQT